LPDVAPELAPLGAVIARHRLSARRGLGQNFLLDLNLTRRIAREAGVRDGSTVIEIGPGPGGLTRALLAEGASHVIAIERDPRCVAALEDLCRAYPDRLTVMEGDALKIDAAALAAGQAGDVLIVANLPYNIATPLLIKWLKQCDAFSGLTLMFQKEVALRLVAEPGSRTYGRLSIITQWRCRVRRLFDVSPKAFVPPPKVTSTVVQFLPRSEPLAPAPWPALETVTAAAFGQRRKMLRSALKSLVADPHILLEAANVSPTARAEELPVEAFCAMARALAADTKAR